MDVTGRRQADEAVREREATLQVVINASPDIITILDAEGGIRSMSPAVHRILGRPPVERVGRSAFGSDIIHPDDLERFSEASGGSSPARPSTPRCACGPATPTGTG